MCIVLATVTVFLHSMYVTMYVYIEYFDFDIIDSHMENQCCFRSIIIQIDLLKINKKYAKLIQLFTRA